MEDKSRATEAATTWEAFVKAYNGGDKKIQVQIDSKVCSQCGHATPVYEERELKVPTDRCEVEAGFPECVADASDQKTLWLDLRSKGVATPFRMFEPSDNARYLYNTHGYSAPEWFLTKYGNVLKDNKPEKLV